MLIDGSHYLILEIVGYEIWIKWIFALANIFLMLLFNLINRYVKYVNVNHWHLKGLRISFLFALKTTQSLSMCCINTVSLKDSSLTTLLSSQLISLSSESALLLTLPFLSLKPIETLGSSHLWSSPLSLPFFLKIYIILKYSWLTVFQVHRVIPFNVYT